MIVKITNCTKYTGGGKKPYRLRQRQNITVWLSNSFSNYTLNDILNHFKYGNHELNFMVTDSSKITKKYD